MSWSLPAQGGWLTAVKLLALVTWGFWRPWSEVPLSKVKACTNEVCPKSLLSLGSGLLKVVIFTNL